MASCRFTQLPVNGRSAFPVCVGADVFANVIYELVECARGFDAKYSSRDEGQKACVLG